MKNKNMTLFKYILLYGILVLQVSACEQVSKKEIEIRGIYGHPKPFWDKGYDLSQLGVNAIFVHGGSINEEMVARAKDEDLQVYAEFATLNGKNYVESHPEAWAIDEKGDKVEAASWFMGVCPTDPGFREYRKEQLRDLLNRFNLDGVWMDYVHWHAQFEEPEPILPETCFCDHCISAFSKDTKIEIPEGSTAVQATWILNQQDKAWRDWRCRVIVDWAEDMKKILNELRPGALLGLYHCPWNDHEFNGARRRILGLDYDLLRNVIDVFSPMVYHGRMGRSPEWVEENIQWFCERMEIKAGAFPKVWPIVQAYDDPEVITPGEFETAMKGGLAGQATGVMMFTSYAVAQDSIKTQVMRSIYEMNGSGP